MSDAPPKVSVVMANYNGARYLAQAIGSLRAQTLRDWELLFVDDASSDASLDVARAAADGDPRASILVQPGNAGPGAARNRGLDAARGEWVAVFDSDDLMAPDRLARLVRLAEEEKADIAADNLAVFADRPDRARPLLSPAQCARAAWVDLAGFIESNRLYSALPDLGYLKPLIRRDLIEAARLRYDPRLRIGEDYDFLARLLTTTGGMRLEAAPLYQYRRHAASTSHRLRRSEIAALMQASVRFRGEVRPLSRAEDQALRRRERSLISLLAYDRVIAALKAGNWGAAAWMAAARPGIWPLLGRPLLARLGRLRAAGASVLAQGRAPSAEALP